MKTLLALTLGFTWGVLAAVIAIEELEEGGTITFNMDKSKLGSMAPPFISSN